MVHYFSFEEIISIISIAYLKIFVKSQTDCKIMRLGLMTLCVYHVLNVILGYSSIILFEIMPYVFYK